MNAGTPMALNEKQPEVKEQCERLQSIVDSMLYEINDLDSQLLPILRQKEPLKDPQNKIERVLVPLAEGIKQTTDQLLSGLNHLRDIRTRIEI